MITENVKRILEDLEGGNCFDEPITLVAAIKTQTVDAINEAIKAGITDVGDNHVQEFREKYDLIQGGNRHFIGHLQTNKVKYLIGKTYLYQSVDRMELANELSKRSANAGVVSDLLVQVNIGNEESKGGFEYAEAKTAYEQIRALPNLRVKGFMAMLPISPDTAYLASLVRDMRILYDDCRKDNAEICYLSMGMSGDYRLCVDNGSNMVRIGSTLFGARDYTK